MRRLKLSANSLPIRLLLIHLLEVDCHVFVFLFDLMQLLLNLTIPARNWIYPRIFRVLAG